MLSICTRERDHKQSHYTYNWMKMLIPKFRYINWCWDGNWESYMTHGEKSKISSKNLFEKKREKDSSGPHNSSVNVWWSCGERDINIYISQ